MMMGYAKNKYTQEERLSLMGYFMIGKSFKTTGGWQAEVKQYNFSHHNDDEIDTFFEKHYPDMNKINAFSADVIKRKHTAENGTILPNPISSFSAIHYLPHSRQVVAWHRCDGTVREHNGQVDNKREREFDLA